MQGILQRGRKVGNHVELPEVRRGHSEVARADGKYKHRKTVKRGGI